MLFKFTAAIENVHTGNLESTIAPRLEINSGDTVVFNTLPLLNGELKPDITLEKVLELRQGLISNGMGGYPITGPFFVSGANPGDVLEIRINKLVPGDYAVTYIYPSELKKGTIPEDFPEGHIKTIRFSDDKTSAEIFPGVVVPLRPFFGLMAVAPKPGETFPAFLPGYYGGNMDNKELVAGTKLYLPVNVPGALFMAADAHAAQGDGEVCITALETLMEEAELQFFVRKDMKLERPMAETPSHWITMGFREDLDEAMKMALRDAVDFISARFNLTKHEAYILCSVAVDFRVTQVVDGNKGIHGMISKDIFKKGS